MPARLFRHSGSIVLSLRLSFALLLAAVIAIGLSSASQFRTIAERKADLTNRAIPLLTHSQELVRLLSTQSSEMTALRDINLRADLDEIERLAQARHDQFNQTIDQYLALSPADTLSDAAHQIFESTDALIQLQKQRQQLELLKSSQLAELQTIIDRVEVEVEGFRLDVLTNLQTNIDRIYIDPEASKRVFPLSVELNTLILLGLRFETVQELTELAADRGTGGQSLIASDLNFSIREMVGLISRLSGDAAKTQITSELIAARTLISGPGGILETVDAQAGALQRINENVAAGQVQIDRIGAEVVETTTRAGLETERTSTMLDQAIRTVSSTNVLMIVVFGGGFVLLTLLLVELQLNRRIQSLIASVRHLAAGRFDRPITISGNDELGEIAGALRQSQAVAVDLERSNADLQSFAYAASHDLKTPLRAITDLAEWTLEDAKDELSDDNYEKLLLLSNRATRLSNLLDGLLLYSQVDGMVVQNEAIDLPREVEAIADLLDPDGKFTVIVDPPAPAFSAAVVPLGQILTNLISNAMKHHDKGKGTIQVSARLVGNAVELTVADDGPGIPPEFHDRIFELFQKLESRDAVEGAGIGLALVKKLSERHGGGVNVGPVAQDDRGTKFSVKLSAMAA